jgi:hypothetical protein
MLSEENKEPHIDVVFNKSTGGMGYIHITCDFGINFTCMFWFDTTA